MTTNPEGEIMNTTITIDGIEYVRADSAGPSKTQIVIAQRGWIFVGNVSEDGDDLVIRDARNIRIWGTTKGLGELVDGPVATTKHDSYGTVRLHKLAVVARIDSKVSMSKWR